VALREALAFTGADDLRQRHCSADLLRARGRAALDNARPPSPEVLLGELHAAERAYIIYSLNGILTKLAKIRCPGQMAALLESHRLEAEVLIPKMRQLTDSIRLYASHQEPEHRCEAMAAVRYWLELRDNVGKYQPLHSFGKRMGLFVHPDKIHALNLHRTEQELAQSLYALTSELSTTADSLAAPAL
jgi:hypothetical protein